jgi:hypothetical protein
MATETMPPSLWSAAAQNLAQRAQRLIRNPLVSIGCAGLLILVLAVRLSTPQGSATLHVKMQHGFRSADITILIDDSVAYTGHVSGVARKRFGVLPTGMVQGSFSQALQVPSGNHNVRVQLSAPSEAYDHTARITGHFAPTSDTDLVIAAARNNDLALSLQGVTAAAAGDAGDTWYAKYGSSLVMTVIGTIVSAITAFLVKELPAVLRRTSQPKA